MASETTGAERSSGGLVTVKYAAFNATLDGLAGMTVGQIREKMASQWNIEDGSTGHYGKEQLADDTVVEAGKVLTFHRPLGEKGKRALSR